tara:strand:- start:929 stop:1366 length:438 start_codon:yes stop_codon:yes gene_type:complete
MHGNLPNTLLLTYQAEYESDPDITIDMLCDKYSISTKQLKGYTKWAKTTDNTISAPTTIISNPIVPLVKPKEELLLDIDTFKALAVAHAIKFMNNDAEFAEVKEFKDMVAIVDSLEKSYKDDKNPTGTTINIAIQNLVEKFQDDC